MDTTSAPVRPAPRPATVQQLRWLDAELPGWVAEGLLRPEQADTIRGRYSAVRTARRFSLARLLLAIGGCFVGVGVIWLVAANLDQLPPLLRFGVVVLFWLALLAAGELLHARRGVLPSPVIGTVRMLAALAFGAVVFQAAQSLQVPAYEPRLVGVWALGALLHAYAVRSFGPLLVGIATGTTWSVWQLAATETSPLAVVLGLVLGGTAWVGLAALHRGEWARFAAPWREVGAVLLLAGLFGAAVPAVTTEGFEWTGWLVGGLVVAVTVALATGVLAPGRQRLAPLGALATAGLAALLVLWETGSASGLDAGGSLTAADWLHAAVSVAAYVLVAVGVAVLGVLFDSPRLTAVATLALVVFTTFQAFAVFAQIIQGAWLFLVLGLVFLGTGFGFDRARRELAASLETDPPDPSGARPGAGSGPEGADR